MLKSIIGLSASVECNNCKMITDHDLTDIRSDIVEEFGQYENLSFICPGCESTEIFNMNIPVNDIDEPYKTGDLPESEEIQRYYVRLLIRTARADFKT